MKPTHTMNNERGLTLIELITTMAILGIMAASAVPNFTVWRNNYQLRSETERVHLDLLSARMSAMKSGNNVVVTFNSAAHSYSILNDTNNNGTADTGEPFGSRALENNVRFGFAGGSIDDMDGTSRSETVVMGASDIVTFDPRGQADLSGVLFLIHSNHLAENDNSRLRGINIIQATGAAELWRYNPALTIPWD